MATDIATPTTPATPDAILDHAERLFQEHGYLAVSTRDIREAAGVSQPTLYYHFKDKAELYLKVMRRTLERTAAGIAAARAASSRAGDRLVAIAGMLLADSKTDQRGMMRDTLVHLDAERRERGYELYRQLVYAPLTAIMAEGIAAGELRADDPSALARAYLGLCTTFVRTPPDARYEARVVGAGWIVTHFLCGAGNS